MSKPGAQLEYFEIVAGHSIFRPSGQMSLDQAVQLVTSAITFAREQHIRKIMVVTTGLTGFKPLDLVTRYFFIHEWARAAASRVCVAVVAKPELIDPQKFGVKVAANAGLISDVF
jgi:hypothetical protein